MESSPSLLLPYTPPGGVLHCPLQPVIRLLENTPLDYGMRQALPLRQKIKLQDWFQSRKQVYKFKLGRISPSSLILFVQLVSMINTGKAGIMDNHSCSLYCFPLFLTLAGCHLGSPQSGPSPNILSRSKGLRAISGGINHSCCHNCLTKSRGP